MDLQEKVQTLPNSSGVYIMKNIEGEIIYIGKAKNLRNRVSSYFNASKKNFKTNTMVSKIFNFEYILTPSENDALILECNLIKKNQPFYNILLKDGKNFPYIKINLKQKFPNIVVTRKVISDGAKYFGPYLNNINIKDLLNVIKLAFKLRTCKLNLENGKILSKPCLNYHTGNCIAPCIFRDEKTYQKEINKVVDFLGGEYKTVKELLENKMIAFAKDENFEEALKMRESIKMIEQLKQKAVVVDSKNESFDVFGIGVEGLFSSTSYMVVREGKLLGAENFILNTGHEMVSGDEISDLLINFIIQHYSINGIAVSKILVPEAVEDCEMISSALTKMKGSKVEVMAPKAGSKFKLMKDAQINALEFIKKNIDIEKQKEEKTTGAVKNLASILGLKNIPNRIECFDVSNTSGTNSVASMSVLINGEKSYKDYRKFKIKTVEGANDYASHAEVLTRRLGELTKGTDSSFSQKPDLIVVDGGKGQLSVTSKILFEGRSDIDIIGLAEKNEEIFMVDNNEPIVLPRSSYALKLLQQARDEAHRFAITFHKELRSKQMQKSALDSVALLGAIKKKALLMKFKTIDKIKNASKEELMTIEGIGQKLAENILKELTKK